MKFKKESLLHLSVLAFIVLALVIIVSNNKKGTGIEFPVASPFYEGKAMTEEGANLKRELVKTDLKVGDLRLVDGGTFNVVYFIQNDNFQVEIKSSPYKDNKIKAEQWFLDKGFKGFDLCNLRISFVPSKEIVDKLDLSDEVFSMCPVNERRMEASSEAI